MVLESDDNGLNQEVQAITLQEAYSYHLVELTYSKHKKHMGRISPVVSWGKENTYESLDILFRNKKTLYP